MTETRTVSSLRMVGVEVFHTTKKCRVTVWGIKNKNQCGISQYSICNRKGLDFYLWLYCAVY